MARVTRSTNRPTRTPPGVCFPCPPGVPGVFVQVCGPRWTVREWPSTVERVRGSARPRSRNGAEGEPRGGGSAEVPSVSVLGSEKREGVLGDSVAHNAGYVLV